MIKNYFTKSEIFRNCSATEILYFQVNHMNNILSLHVLVNHIRHTFGHPICITSWCRDEIHNKKAGGVPTSQHLLGQAMDCYPQGSNPRELWNHIKALVDKGEIEVGQCILYPTRNFVHISIPCPKHKNEFFTK